MKNTLPLISALSLFISGVSFADHRDDSTSVFVTHEVNGESNISSAGVAFNFKQHDSNFGGAISMSLGRADIVTTKLNVEDYLAWELGGKIGYFSDVSLYLEAGVDLGELFGRGHLDEDSYHDHDHYYDDDDYYHDRYHDHDHDFGHNHYHRSDSLDAYVGIGGGIKLDRISINGQVRYRQIDSEDWEALDDVYSGVTVSFSF